MPGHLADKTAFVTAAGQGIGRETALAFAAEGARVIATDIDEAKVRLIASDSIRSAKLDVLHAADIARAEIDAGPIDILFNCAGVVHQGTLMDANDLRQKDLAPIFGSESIVSEVLHKKRVLNKTHIEKLSKRFHVSPAAFF